MARLSILPAGEGGGVRRINSATLPTRVFARFAFLAAAFFVPIEAQRNRGDSQQRGMFPKRPHDEYAIDGNFASAVLHGADQTEKFGSCTVIARRAWCSLIVVQTVVTGSDNLICVRNCVNKRECGSARSFEKDGTRRSRTESLDAGLRVCPLPGQRKTFRTS